MICCSHAGMFTRQYWHEETQEKEDELVQWFGMLWRSDTEHSLGSMDTYITVQGEKLTVPWLGMFWHSDTGTLTRQCWYIQSRSAFTHHPTNILRHHTHVIQCPWPQSPNLHTHFEGWSKFQPQIRSSITSRVPSSVCVQNVYNFESTWMRWILDLTIFL